MRATLALLDKKGPNAEQVLIMALESLVGKGSEVINVITPRLPEKQELQQSQSETVSSAAIGIVASDKEPKISETGNGAIAFHGSIYSPPSSRPPPAIFAEKALKGPERAIEKLLRDFEGDFFAVIAEPERIIAGRDPMGVQPLYYGESAVYAAIGTNRKVLWKLGMNEPRSFPPGHLGVITNNGFEFNPIKTLAYSEPIQSTVDAAADELVGILERTICVRVQNVKELAVAFSGGLDSSIIAFLAKKLGANVHLVHVGLEGQRETEEAKIAASSLNLPISIHLFRERDVASIVAKVVELVEEPDPVKAAIGIPIYWAAQKSAEAGLKVLFTGQGADELFGGYHRYFEQFRLQGEEKTRKIMYNDTVKIHEDNLERDQKICNFHHVELRLPFASYEMAEFAVGLPVELKIGYEMDSRKLVLRRAAERMGLPTRIARKPKKALQYSTGVGSILKKLAREQNTTTGHYVKRIFDDLKLKKTVF